MIALSIRQPWAWLILNAGKDVENRCWSTNFRGRFLIHAAKGCTKAEYEDALDFADMNGFDTDLVPELKLLERGGIVGRAELSSCVSQSDSDWFCGPYGFLLKNPQRMPFVPWKGQLGFFEVDFVGTGATI